MCKYSDKGYYMSIFELNKSCRTQREPLAQLRVAQHICHLLVLSLDPNVTVVPALILPLLKLH